jgi:hypothetical protein
LTDSLQKIVDLMKDAGLPAQRSYEKNPPQLPCITIMLSEVKPRYLLDRKLYAMEDIYEMTVWSQDKEERATLLRKAFNVLSQSGFNKFSCKYSFHETAQAYKAQCSVDFLTIFDQAAS